MDIIERLRKSPVSLKLRHARLNRFSYVETMSNEWLARMFINKQNKNKININYFDPY